MSALSGANISGRVFVIIFIFVNLRARAHKIFTVRVSGLLRQRNLWVIILPVGVWFRHWSWLMPYFWWPSSFWKGSLSSHFGTWSGASHIFPLCLLIYRLTLFRRNIICLWKRSLAFLGTTFLPHILWWLVFQDMIFPCFELQRWIKSIFGFLTVTQHNFDFSPLLLRVSSLVDSSFNLTEPLSLDSRIFFTNLSASGLEHFLNSCKRIGVVSR